MKKYLLARFLMHISRVEVKHFYGSLYYTQSQGAIEDFNKTVPYQHHMIMQRMKIWDGIKK